ncbi:gliding motility-associated C-terminal domain-containing protein [Belliella aquatica]|nr:gliding motility-associated C-terminal domain-containing protein [Belliella aquatica]MCH7406201.1 gliding motility-associated C-terminal domain-containing protein [Belliella aquatica]
MKSTFKCIKFYLIFAAICLISCVLNPNKSFSQGFNNNEWIFGYCGPNVENNYLSFGKGGEPIVRTLPGSIVVGENNNAIAIDPITGQILFYTNGELVYNYDDDIIQGAPNGINGNIDGRQQVAISALSYDTDGDKLFYTFHITPGGQLQYSVIDMNAPGAATGNQPPLGAVTVLDQNIGPATGAIAVVKSSQSPSYLISFSGGSLISRRIEATQGDFTDTDDISIPFTPKAIIFNEENGQLALIPENPNEDIILIDYDTATGNFGNISTISQSGGADALEGVAFSPDGAFVYFSRGNELFRVPADQLDAEPELIPLENDIFRIYDIKVGPDGSLYYIYEEVEGGPQLIGRLTNPDEEELGELEIEEDPFDGVDFCGRIFPQFAPNADIDAEVDFTWQPEEPCANNPVQLTSSITPENYRPVSFEWSFNPPLTDEEGNELEIDFNQEHLLIPEEATSDESVTATLLVTFADGTTREVTKTINLAENDIEANFTPQDTTICAPNCIDLMPLLEAQAGGGQQGGETPGGVGGGQGGNYEYFWSNKRDEGWGPEAPNEVCRPGLYWVLVREEGSSCYAYASIRVRIWDLPDQSNNVWYFGDGAGLDFNPDPDDPDGPTPRPVSHPNNIPAGTTTISDETGQVLFYTDGQTVWDLNGDVMENGENIGGSNQSSQSVLAVPIPQDETIFYLFTTQRAADGSNQVKFSLVDIKAENPLGVGNVVTKDNFLFSPSTEHSAALAAGDTTWVLFHELGNNTFRAYPVSEFGIGQPVFSSVGSAHNFATGVGSMKFSPDGTKVAVTIRDGACSRVEIFDFDGSSGSLTEYALLDLGCNSEDVYGIEFSNDSNRLFVTYTGGVGKVEEFIFQSPTSNDEDIDLECASCLNNAGSRAAREQCILDSRNELDIEGPIGAIQIGPDGQIYVARPGQGSLGTISPGQNCSPSTAVTDGVFLEAGTTSNLGLPSFIQQSGSSIPEPEISGPERLCLDPEVGAEGLFEGAGEPDIDSYFWTIVHEDGEEVLTEFGGPGEEFQSLTHFFDREGVFTVSLRVDRCGDPEYFRGSLEVLVVAPPELTLEDDVTLCSGTPVTLTAIDGYDPAEGLYDFEWRNAAGFQFGDENSNSITVDEESIYTVTVSYRVPEGSEFFDTCPATQSVFVGPAFEFELTQTAEEVCYDETIVVFAPDTPVAGEWFYQRIGDPTRVQFPVGLAFELELEPALDLPGPGQYEIIFVTEDPILEGCLAEKVLELEVFPLPNFDIVYLNPTADCNTPDGIFEITVLVDVALIEILETGDSFTNVSAGTVLPVFTDLAPGNYTIRAETAFGCEFTETAFIINTDPPAELQNINLERTNEICGNNEILPGSITITLSNPPTGNYIYTITRQGDGQVLTGPLSDQTTIVEAMHGEYFIEVEDVADNCALSVGTATIDRKFLVDFTVPSNVEACEAFVFAPLSANDNLSYLVEDANGNIINSADGTNYELTISGVYTITGFDGNNDDCPRTRTITVNINDAIDYDLIESQVDCVDGVTYQAVLNGGVIPEEVFFFWRNESGTVVGRSQDFNPSTAGIYTLDVQPRSGSACPTPPIEFTVGEFVTDLEYDVEVLPFCLEDPFTTISIIGDLTDTNIEWTFVQGGTRTPLPDFTDLDVITVLENGIYEFVIRNNFGCIVGQEQVAIRQSNLVAPVLEPSYTICAIENVVVELDPGIYDNYEWYIEGEEEPISTDPTFTPTEKGNYRLVVFDDLGCFEEISFVVEENCDLMVRFPNAMRPSDPTKQFVVYTNDFIDELSVFIYNRWGELIFYCEEVNLPRDVTEGYCPWDGTVNGQMVPIGTYPVVVRFRSNNQNITKTLREAIVVIE